MLSVKNKKKTELCVKYKNIIRPVIKKICNIGDKNYQKKKKTAEI